MGFSTPEEEPGGFTFSEPAEPPRPRINSAPPNTEALDRLPAPAPPPPAPPPAPPPPSKPPDFNPSVTLSSAAPGVRGRARPRAGGARASEQGGSGGARRPAESFRVDALDLRSHCAAEGRALGTPVSFGTSRPPRRAALESPPPGRVPGGAGRRRSRTSPRAGGRSLVLLQPARSTTPASGSGHAAARPDHHDSAVRFAEHAPGGPGPDGRPVHRTHLGTTLAAGARGHPHGNTDPDPRRRSPRRHPRPRPARGAWRKRASSSSAATTRRRPEASRRACGRTPTLASASSSSWPARKRRSEKPWRTPAGRICSSCPSTTRARAAIASVGGCYESEGRATSAMSAVPAYFREGGAKPKVSPTACSASLIA